MRPTHFPIDLPAPGVRLRVPALHGSSDALFLAETSACVRPLVVVTATAQHAQRLKAEIPFFAPALRVALLPDWETPALRSLLAASGSGLGAARDPASDHARRVRRGAGAGRHRARPPAAGGISGRLHLLPETGRKALHRRAAHAAHGCQLYPRLAGAVTRRVQRARRLDRPLSDGQRAALSHRSPRRRDR